MHQVTVRALLTKPVGGDNFPVRVDLDSVVANLLMAVERAEDVPRKQEETVMVNQHILFIELWRDYGASA